MANSSATVDEIWDLIKETRIDMKESRTEMKEFNAKMEQFHVGMEFDIVVVNGDEVVAVEVKTTLTPDKVSYFLSAMEQFKRYFPDYRHKRVYGAVAYLRSEAEARRYAEKQGLFVIRATGDSASIINAEDFRPKEFPSQAAA